MADSPNRLSKPTLVPPPTSSNRDADRWRWGTFARWTGILVLFYLFGPVIFFGRDAQLEAGGRAWHAEERWARVFGSAVLSLLWYVPVLVFHTALAGFWTSIFESLALFLHLPFIRLLGDTSFWLPLPSSMVLRWVLALPLTSWITLLLEAIQPHTTWETRRIVSPDEQVQLAKAVAAEENKRQAAQPRRLSQALVTVSASKTISTGTQSRTSTKRPNSTHAAQTSQSATPAAKRTLSLWNQIDWSQVPDSDPVKQAAIAEAERQAGEHRNAERTRSVLSQVARQKVATTESPLPLPAPSPTYNWDEGEGTVTDS